MSRKNKTLRAFLHQTQSPTIEQAWDTAWKHAQKKFHARSMQDMEEQLEIERDYSQALEKRIAELELAVQAENEKLNAKADLLRQACEDLISDNPELIPVLQGRSPAS